MANEAKKWAARTNVFDEALGAGRWVLEFEDYDFTVGIGYIGADGKVRDAIYLVRAPDEAGGDMRVISVSHFGQRAAKMVAGTLPADDPWRVRMCSPEEAIAAIRDALEDAAERA